MSILHSLTLELEEDDDAVEDDDDDENIEDCVLEAVSTERIGGGTIILGETTSVDASPEEQRLSSVPNEVAAAGAGNVGLYDAVRL